MSIESRVIGGVLTALMVGSLGAQPKAERADFGKREFNTNCASCHGWSGRGDGPVASLLTKRPTDLTQLAKLNGGVFPMARVYDSIEAGSIATHGTRDMPVWGLDYRIQAADYYQDVPYDPEAYVRARILALIEYVNRLQVK